MAKKKVINLGARFQNAFGYVASGEGESLRKVNFKDKNGLSASTSEAKIYVTSNGSFEEMTIRGNGFELRFASAMGNESSLGKIFAPPPIVSYDRQKKIIDTPVDDSDEEPTDDAFVVERWNSGKWDIKIQGLLIDMENHAFPKDKLAKLNQFFDVNAPFAVEGDWWDALNIKSIYIESFSPAGVQGFEDTIQFSLQAYSMKPVEFFLKNK